MENEEYGRGEGEEKCDIHPSLFSIPYSGFLSETWNLELPMGC